MKTLHKQYAVLDVESLLDVNGGYSGGSGGGSTNYNYGGSYSSSRSTSSSYSCGTVSIPNYSTTTSYRTTSSGCYNSGYSANYALLCGWAKALGIM